MAQKQQRLWHQLRLLTADLHPSSRGQQDDLHRARVSIASALSVEGSSVALPPAPALFSTSVKSIPDLEAALDAAIGESSPDLLENAAFVITRRDLPLSLTGLSALESPSVTGQVANFSFGPFQTHLGRPVWIDLFRIVRQVRFVRIAGGAPFLQLPIREAVLGLPARPESTFQLAPGSVWIASQQLAPTAPSRAYTGLLVRGGSLRLSSGLTQSGPEVIVPATVTCTLELDLNGGTAPTGTGAGQDARLSSVTLPARATFVFNSSGASAGAVSPASLNLYGSQVDVAVANGGGSYNAALGQILYSGSTAAQSFIVRDTRSDLFLPSGAAPIQRVAWALPVAITSAASLGSASGAGALAIFVELGLFVAWKGETSPVPAGALVMLVGPGLITVIAAQIPGFDTRTVVTLWTANPGEKRGADLTVSWRSNFALRYVCSASGSEILALSGAIDGNFDRPITVSGSRVYVHADTALILIVESPTFSGLIVEAALQPPKIRPSAALAFSIENAVFRTSQANSLVIVAAFNGTQASSGGLELRFNLQYLLPILPDPYASNFELAVGRAVGGDTSLGVLGAVVVWGSSNAPLLTYLLPANASIGLHPTQTDFAQAAVREEPAFIADTGALVLLDLSTNVDQFGVAWRASASRTVAATNNLIVDAMFLESSSDSVFVLTVPSVLWEPVYTDPPPSPPYPAGYPSPISFPNSGGPTAIGVESAKLVRVAPGPALDNLVENFTTSATPATASALLTLPFGMKALATLTKSTGPFSKGATLGYVRPNFVSESVTGGHQISLRAVDPAFPDYPALQGYTVQLKNTLYNGVPTSPPVSILGVDVDTIFNGYLGPGGTNQLIPVTRLDLSGYGESLFSDWRNQTNDVTAVSKARFDVLVGRTAVEVIQVRSIKYPYGVRVVRTITINRLNTGVVTRHDSGWQPASDGVYDFTGSSLVVHPGVVQKIHNVSNIRDTGQILDLGGVQVAGVFFDGDLILDGTFKGAGPDGVPARQQVGYIQLTPEASGGPLTPAQYERLIQLAGPLGGNIECLLKVATSGLAMKLGRVGVGVTAGMAGPEFVMTAWGSPQFPYGGQWSFLQQTGAGTAPELVDTNLGIPLIRAGAVPAPPPATSPYRFADPKDLANPASPASDYGIVHATGTQRVFFPRPKIEANAPPAISSTVAPTLADPYTLANSVGFFPRTDAAIPFPDANYTLGIAPDGNIKLNLPSPSFPVTVGQRTIAESNGIRGYADYTGATVKLAIDTAAAVPWTFELDHAASAMSATGMGELMRTVGDFQASAAFQTKLVNSNVIFGGALGVVQDVLKFLEALGIPSPMSVAMTNSLELKITLKIPLDDELNTLMPPCGVHFEDTDVTVGYTIDLKDGKVGAEFELGAAIFIPTPFCTCIPAVPPELPHIAGLQGVGLIKFNAKISTDVGQVITLTLGAGIGVSFKIAGDFKVTAYYVETEFLIFGDVFGLGVGALLKGSIDLEIISVDISVEAKMAVLKVNPSSTCSAVTIWGAAQVTLAIEITICWVIDIDFEWQTEWSRNLNGGPCPLPDVL